jgi:hypothetical protein
MEASLRRVFWLVTRPAASVRSWARSASPWSPRGYRAVVSVSLGQDGARENADDEWRAYLDVDDDLPVFCPECVEREFVTGGAPE